MTYEWSNLDERYFEWLYDQISPDEDRDPSRSHYMLCSTMYKLPFETFVRRDENRAEYGLDLRENYLDATGQFADDSWMNLECSIFEMLVALSHAASFQTDTPAGDWFWIMVRNIGLERYNDERYSEDVHSSVVATLRRVIRRKYEASGRGGFFPLREPREDQRKVELWYQLSAYLIENCEF